jgi:tRNA nucleotidyltransferase (CCA-adding enzyme)
MAVTATDLRERVRTLPGMELLLPAVQRMPPVYLVGGAVRDLLRGSAPVDLDFVVQGNAHGTARELAAGLGGQVVDHERFGTATIRAPALALPINLATARRETYERPGALPTVEPAGILDDLMRRDFTVNAMAVGLLGDDLGHLYDPSGGLADLRRGSVRVLHERSFVDDPTRLLRAVRYEARLGFALDPDTERLARAAAAADAFATVSGARIRDELIDLLTEEEAPAAVERLHALRLDRALHPALVADAELVASAALGATAIGADRGRAALAALVAPAPQELAGWLADLHLPAPVRDTALRAARRASLIARELRRELRPSEIHALLRDEPPESLALALALQAPPEPILRFVTDLSRVRLEITGQDLLRAGVPESPAVGRALEETLRRKLDGELSGRDDELAVALETAKERR